MNFPFQTYGSTLFIGCGGGYDVFGAIPIIKMAIGKPVFASYGRSKEYVVQESCDGPDGKLKAALDWAKVYTIGKLGVQGVKEAIDQIVKWEHIENIVAVDGGVDALMCGDEENAGTLLEDSIVLGAINECAVPNVYLACVGMGTESEEQLNHYRALENIAWLAANGDFLGSCSLVPGSEEFLLYKEICDEAWTDGRKSHIQSRIIPAVEGQFGCAGTGADAQCYGVSEEVPAFLSPLMGIYWFFDLRAVAYRNQIIPNIKDSVSFTDAMMLHRQSMKKPTRSKEIIPL